MQRARRCACGASINLNPYTNPSPKLKNPSFARAQAALPVLLLGASGPSSGDAKGKEVRMWGTAPRVCCHAYKTPTCE